MAKKNEKELLQLEYEKMLDRSKILKIPVVGEMKKSFISYAMAVNVSRAIPDVRDGLKPVHRRILYAMSEDLKLSSDKPHRKSARIVGEVLGKYHPHGDLSVYDALVRLAQDFSIRYPLVDGHGNFGSVDGDPAAAMRYTEARLAPMASELLRDIGKRTVDFYPNFDESEIQPSVLPARFPNILVNGADGIAVGMATSIPPHNLREVINGTIAQIDNPDITVEELMKFIPAPDYPTSGILMGRAAIKHAYKTGRGGIVLRARAEIEEYTTGNQTRQRIVVTELPYQVNKAKLIETIANFVKDKKLDGISDIKEESDRGGMRLVIEVKRDANAQVVLNTLYKRTQLQVSGGITLLALVNGEPKVLNLKEMLSHYIQHQKEVIVRRTKFDLEKAEERAHILEGLVVALEDIDNVIKVIKASRDRVEAIEKLTANFTLSEKQAQAILDMRLQRLTSLEVEKLRAEYADLQALVAELKSILADMGKVMEVIKTELAEVRDKYGDDRRTELSYDYGEIDIADLIEKEDIVVSMTHQGYIKRMPTTEYRTQGRGGRGIIAHRTKEEDFVRNMFISSTHDDILFFTNYGKVYRIKGYEIPEAMRQAKGRAIVNLLMLSEGEKVSAVIPIEENTKGYIIFATRGGLIKKTALAEFESIRKVGKIAILLNEGDQLISVQLTRGYDEILIGSNKGKCIRFSEEDVRPMGRNTQGVRSMKLDEGDFVVDMAVLKDGYHILTITENGYGKRTEQEDYRLQSRAGKGIKAGTFNKKTGNMVSLQLVSPDEDVMLISDNGTIIRIRANDISIFGRDTQGVRVMRIKDDGKVCSVAVSPHEEEEETPAEEGAVTADSGAEEGNAPDDIAQADDADAGDSE